MPHLLVIDDDERVRRLFLRTLSRHFVVECTESVEAALVLIDAGTDAGVALFDVVLCDLNLPRMSGHDFHDYLKHRSHALETRLVLITGTQPAADDAFAMMLGERYVMKTCPMSDLTAMLCRVAAPRVSSPPCAPLAAA